MKITSIELEKDIDVHITELIIEHYEEYGFKPEVMIISKPLFNWFKNVLMKKADQGHAWRRALECDLCSFEGINIVKTLKDNIIEVY